MKRSLFAFIAAVSLFALPTLARAEEAEAHAEAGEVAEPKRSVADVVMAHVSDEREIEFEAPFGEHNVLKFELPKWHVNIGNTDLDLSLTKHTVWLWIAAVMTVLLLMVFRPKTIAPKGMGTAIEVLVLFVRDELAKPAIGDADYKTYTPYLLSCFFFILVANLIGLIPYTATATGNISVTAALALCTFLVTQFASIRAAGLGGFTKHLAGIGSVPLWLSPLFVIVEIIGLFTKPFALAMRLFANMMAGHMVLFFLLGLIFILKTILVAPLSVFLAVCIYMLELFVAFLQAYVFTMLSAIFIGMGVAMGHHEHDAHADAHDPKHAH